MKWKQLCEIADTTVRAARKRLPAEVCPAADGLPVTVEPWPSEAMLEDEGVESDILGLFVGPDHGTDATATMPPQILLFLENLWDYAEGDEAVFREEVRITYLHELGHYLGWDEDELTRRGLD
ncbi:MAG TPA: metallopeptidase family protein [Opitutaceae bacterium]|nr:metallopeptidase family protein [Opitutaceae bacterium]